MAAQLYNNVTDQLSSSVSAAATQISVANGSKFTNPPAGDYFPLHMIASNGSHEIVHVTAVSGNTLTVERAQEGTDPLVFIGNETVQIRPTRQSLRELESIVASSTGLQTVANALDRRGVKFTALRAPESGEFDPEDYLETATKVTEGLDCYTLGYHEKGDGGGNDYTVVAAGTGTADGGSFIDLTGSGLQAKGFFTREIYCAKFGATNGHSGDDAQYINNAIAYARTLLSAPSRFSEGNGLTIKVTHDPRLATPINLTRIKGTQSFVFDGGGCTFHATATGKCGIDVMGSNSLTFRDFNVWADQADGVACGIQIGRDESQVVSQNHYFDNVKTYGYYTIAGLYNLASETVLHNKCTYSNAWDTVPYGNTYCVVNDSYNSFGVTSDYANDLSLFRNVRQSFNENLFIGCSFYRRGFTDPNYDKQLTAIYMDQRCQSHHYLKCFAVSAGNSPMKIAFKDSGIAHQLNSLHFDMHCEADPRSIAEGTLWLIEIDDQSAQQNLKINNLYLKDHNPHVTAALISAPRAGTTCDINGEIVIDNNTVAEFDIFAADEKFVFNGKVSFPDAPNKRTQFIRPGSNVKLFMGGNPSITTRNFWINGVASGSSMEFMSSNQADLIIKPSYPLDAAPLPNGVLYQDADGSIKTK